MICAHVFPYVIWSSSNTHAVFRKATVGDFGATVTVENISELSEQENQIYPVFDLVYCPECLEPQLEILTIKGNQFWKVSLISSGGNSQKDNNVPFIHLNASSVTCLATDGRSVFVTTTKYSSIFVFDLATGVMKHIDSVRLAIPKPDNIAQSQVPGVKSHLIQKIEFSSFEYAHTVKIAQTPMTLPVPPSKCIFPNLWLAEKVYMLSNSSAFVTVGAAWNNETVCTVWAKPPVVYHLEYAFIKQGKISTPVKNDCSSELTFQHIKSEKTSVNSYRFEFTGIKNNASYCFKISVEPALNTSLRYLWYAGVPDKFKSTTQIMFFKLPDAIGPKEVLTALVPALIVVLVAAVLIAFLWWRYNHKYYMYRYLQRLSASSIHMEELLGRGHFGEVWRAVLTTHGENILRTSSVTKQTVAIKVLKESATIQDEKEFRDESLLMSKLSNEYIIRFIGICMQSRPMMIALEFMNGGALSEYLRQDDVHSLLNPGDLFGITMDLVHGCAYLEQEGYVHCDLSARNCLMRTHNDSLIPQVAKLSDFGLAKDIGSGGLYETLNKKGSTTRVFPIAWTAPEAFQGKYTSKSDIWSFGVLMWEIFSWASVPFGDCIYCDDTSHCTCSALTHQEIEYKVCVEKTTLKHFPLPCYNSFSDPLLNICSVCWKYEPFDRPGFKQLKSFLTGARKEICAAPNKHKSNGASAGRVNRVFKSTTADSYASNVTSCTVNSDTSYAAPLIMRAISNEELLFEGKGGSGPNGACADTILMKTLSADAERDPLVA